ncbi:MAG: DegV family protein, partial [Anaerolineae bacterium]
MRIGVVNDASCDLPRSYLEEHGIHVLPNLLSLGGKRVLDDRDPDKTMQIYRRYLTDRELPCSSAPWASEDMAQLFLEQVVPRYDRVLVIAPDAARSDVFQQATEASYAILQTYRDRREKAGRSGTFALRVLDSGSLGAGHGLLAWRASSLARAGGMPFEKYRAALSADAARTRCLIVPGDLYYLRT